MHESCTDQKRERSLLGFLELLSPIVVQVEMNNPVNNFMD